MLTEPVYIYKKGVGWIPTLRPVPGAWKEWKLGWAKEPPEEHQRNKINETLRRMNEDRRAGFIALLGALTDDTQQWDRELITSLIPNPNRFASLVRRFGNECTGSCCHTTTTRVLCRWWNEQHRRR